MTIVGCTNSEVATPAASMFSNTVDAPKDVQAGELYVVNGTLVNHSDSSWEVLHGANMFTYDVFDSNGDRVSQGDGLRMVNDIGFKMTLQPNEQYSYDGDGHVFPKSNEYTLQAGSYTIVSTAKFRINHENIDYEFEIASEPIDITIL